VTLQLPSQRTRPPHRPQGWSRFGGVGRLQEPSHSRFPPHRPQGAPVIVRVSQTPAPLQIRVLMLMPGPQPGIPHIVPAASRRHAPAPSHPFEQASSGQAPPGSAVPGPTFAQVPSCPGNAHDLQLPAQAVAQQRPCAQTPLAQSLPRWQTSPVGRLPQVPFRQTNPDAHWLSAVQLVRQPLPLHPWKGVHIWAAGTRQSPSAQVPAAVAVVPSQRASRQTVPSR